MLSKIRDFLELIRFSHTIFALPFAILASTWAWIISHRQQDAASFTWLHAAGILLCMVSARSFAMAFNRLVDARFDAANPRTAIRHIPSGRLTHWSVTVFVVLTALTFVLSTLLFLPNSLPFALSIPVLLFLAGYSFTKRFTSLAHYWLGVALMLAPICAWIALRGDVVLASPMDLLPSFMLGLGVLFWVGGFDLIYACQDAEVDKRLGLNSIPARFGVKNALWIASVSHAVMMIPLFALPWVAPNLSLGWVYALGLVVVAGLLIYEHAIISADNLGRVNVAFFQANAVISTVLLVAGTIDAWLE
jgi:4-hydroxybenzoate polyprenyltransferase